MSKWQLVSLPEDLGNNAEKNLWAAMAADDGVYARKNTPSKTAYAHIDKLVVIHRFVAAFIPGEIRMDITSTGKQVSTCGYEYDTVNPNDAWLRLPTSPPRRSK